MDAYYQKDDILILLNSALAADTTGLHEQVTRCLGKPLSLEWPTNRTIVVRNHTGLHVFPLDCFFNKAVIVLDSQDRVTFFFTHVLKTVRLFLAESIRRLVPNPHIATHCQFSLSIYRPLETAAPDPYALPADPFKQMPWGPASPATHSISPQFGTFAGLQTGVSQTPSLLATYLGTTPAPSKTLPWNTPTTTIGPCFRHLTDNVKKEWTLTVTGRGEVPRIEVCSKNEWKMSGDYDTPPQFSVATSKTVLNYKTKETKLGQVFSSDWMATDIAFVFP
jgi:hypothetical protein